MDKLPQCIKTIISSIAEDSGMGSEKLIRVMDNANINIDDMARYENFDHAKTESYGRCNVYDGGCFGIYIMSWNPGDFTAIHSHGHSEWGAVRFFGDATHRNYAVTGNRVKLSSKELLKKGTTVSVCGNLIHAMGNLSTRPFVTLHIYGSNSYRGTITEDCKIYELEKNSIKTSLGPAFINIADNLCKNNSTGIVTDKETLDDYINIITPFYSRIGMGAFIDSDNKR